MGGVQRGTRKGAAVSRTYDQRRDSRAGLVERLAGAEALRPLQGETEEETAQEVIPGIATRDWNFGSYHREFSSIS